MKQKNNLSAEMHHKFCAKKSHWNIFGYIWTSHIGTSHSQGLVCYMLQINTYKIHFYEVLFSGKVINEKKVHLHLECIWYSNYDFTNQLSTNNHKFSGEPELKEYHKMNYNCGEKTLG